MRQLLGNCTKEKTGLCLGPLLILSPDGWNVDIMLEYEQSAGQEGMLGLRMADTDARGLDL